MFIEIFSYVSDLITLNFLNQKVISMPTSTIIPIMFNVILPPSRQGWSPQLKNHTRKYSNNSLMSEFLDNKMIFFKDSLHYNGKLRFRHGQACIEDQI